jgi:hypothetical protein
MASKKKSPKKKKRIPKPENFKPKPRFPKNFRTAKKRGKPRCQAWNGNKGRQCENLPLKGRNHPAAPEDYKTVCRTHGGKTPSGVDSPHWKTGRYSKDLPSGLFQDYVRSLNDPDIISLREELAFLDSLISKDMRKLSDLRSDLGPGPYSVYLEMEAAALAGDPALATIKLEELGEILRAGQSVYRTEDRILDRIEQRRKLADSERRRLVDAHSVVTKEKLRNLIYHLGQTIREEVPDKEVRNRISERLKFLLLNR